MFVGAFGLVFLAVPETLLRVFSDSDALVAAGAPILRVMGLVQLIDAVGITLSGALRGAGLTLPVMLVDLGTGFGLLPPLSYLFGITLGGGLMGAWLALLVWFTLYSVGMVVLFQRSNWEEVTL